MKESPQANKPHEANLILKTFIQVFRCSYSVIDDQRHGDHLKPPKLSTSGDLVVADRKQISELRGRCPKHHRGYKLVFVKKQ